MEGMWRRGGAARLVRRRRAVGGTPARVKARGRTDGEADARRTTCILPRRRQLGGGDGTSEAATETLAPSGVLISVLYPIARLKTPNEPRRPLCEDHLAN